MIVLHEKYKDKGFEVIGVSMDYSVSDVKTFASKNHVPYTLLMSDEKVEKQFGVITIPVSFLIDKSGIIAKKHLGFAPGISDDMEKEIRLLLEDMPLKRNKNGGNRG